MCSCGANEYEADALVASVAKCANLATALMRTSVNSWRLLPPLARFIRQQGGL